MTYKDVSIFGLVSVFIFSLQLNIICIHKFEIDINVHIFIYVINSEPGRYVKIQKKNEKIKCTCDLLYVVFNQMIY